MDLVHLRRRTFFRFKDSTLALEFLFIQKSLKISIFDKGRAV